ncbi:hypothetical protein [Thermococcus sp.]|uniref:hypothetical protein n=1 Tax=Thermococcus sp. TaxID=35749 RepID=UPI002612DF0B|nr:hypothetical protein [Thermococcus sp.]
MAERILEVLKVKYDFLSITLQSLEGAMEDISEETDPEGIYEILVKYVASSRRRQCSRR